MLVSGQNFLTSKYSDAAYLQVILGGFRKKLQRCCVCGREQSGRDEVSLRGAGAKGN